MSRSTRHSFSRPSFSRPSSSRPSSSHRAASSHRVARIAKWATIPAALVISGIVVSQASYSAYSSATSSPTGNWATGTVQLSDDDMDIASFSVDNLKPGDSDSQCIAVTSSGSLPSVVKLYGTNFVTTKALASHMPLTITQGTGGSAGTCSGFTPSDGNPVVYSGTVADLAAHANYATGVGSWNPTGATPETRTYKFDYAVSSTAPNSTQGGTVSLGFTWEAQSS